MLITHRWLGFWLQSEPQYHDAQDTNGFLKVVSIMVGGHVAIVQGIVFNAKLFTRKLDDIQENTHETVHQLILLVLRMLLTMTMSDDDSQVYVKLYN